MKIGAPFNPYKVFQGVFAPYWILEHRASAPAPSSATSACSGLPAGRPLLSLARKLGTSLGVSDRQARDYVKELVQAPG